jgi:ribonucleoside-diphosphate reductase alpha chain
MNNLIDNNETINVINRYDEVVPMNLNSISLRLHNLALMEPRLSIGIDNLVIKTASKLINNIKTDEIDNISSEICASLIINDIEYDQLATRITMSNLHKKTSTDLRKYAYNAQSYIYRNKEIKILDPKVVKFINNYYNDLHIHIDYTKDYNYNYFGIITMMKSYLLSHKYDNNHKVIERPQQMLLRNAIGINLNKVDDNGNVSDDVYKSIIDTYKLLSEKYYTHATPTLFNAGTVNSTLSSCYLIAIEDDLNRIYDRLKDISKISKFSGGVGIHVSDVRSKGSLISSTIGRSEGLVPMLKVFNESTKYVSQGGGKRKGSTAIYIEPWHPDIISCLMTQKLQGIPETLCKELFLALWIPDIFMSRLKEWIKTGKSVMWSLMCPSKCKGLTDSYGEEFTELYTKYESEGDYVKQLPIEKIWILIMSLQIETGKPYLMYKDHVNYKCNQNNLGVIKSSNLCVHGNTLILTEEGYKPIKHLEDKVVKIWDTEKFIDAPVKKTNTNQQLLKIKTSDGCKLYCTKYHRFSIKSNNNIIIKEAKDLSIGDVLIPIDYPVIKGDSKYNIEDPRSNKYFSQVFKSSSKIDFNIPPQCSTIDTKIKWLSRIIDMNGSIMGEINNNYLEIESKDKKFLKSIKIICNTLGLNPSLIKTKFGMSNTDDLILHSCKDIDGNSDEDFDTYINYSLKASVHRLKFNPYDTYKLYKNLNLKTYKIKYNIGININKEIEDITIKSINTVNGLHDTYCLRSRDTEMCVFNGIPTMNCTEITIYSDQNNIGVCNLASICLPRFIIKSNNSISFDFKKLMTVVQKITYNMNNVMDNNKYPIKDAKNSDDNNRPIGIGTQGLSEVFMIFEIPFDSSKARMLNKHIFETIYYGALSASNQLAKIHGPYNTFNTSMTSRGVLQFDLWGITPSSNLWNWDDLKNQIVKYGLRNSLLTAQMPTAGTSIILGHTESVEVPTSNIFTRSTLSGKFQIVNKHLVNKLKSLNLWNSNIRNKIINNDGSIANIEEIPLNVRNIYKTVFEYKLTSFIEMCADREAYICQASSNNRYIIDPTISKLTKMHLLSWKLGLKTSSYYVRVKALTTGSKINTTNNLSNVEIIENNNIENNIEEEECMLCMA